MLLHLKVRDFAIIDNLELEFDSGFTAVTGETGAGKSILVDALMALLGGRVGNDAIRDGADAAEVEALFDISGHPQIQERLTERDLGNDDPGTLVLRRVIGAKGRAKVSINGRLSTVATLHEVVRGLVDISGQHEQQSLLQVDNHLEILDIFGHLQDLQNAYKRHYQELQSVSTEVRQLSANTAEKMQKVDYLRFQLNEIDQARPLAGEDLQLEKECQKLLHAEKLRHGSAMAEALLYGDDGSAFDKLGKALVEMEVLARLDSDLSPALVGLETARREIQEAGRVLQRYQDRVDADPEKLTQLQDRLAELRRLTRKHGCSLADILEKRGAIAQELEQLEHRDERLTELVGLQEQLEARVWQNAHELTEARRAAAKHFDKAVKHELADMDLEQANIVTRIESLDHLSERGADRIEFLWSANAGESERPLAKIASGGELSRLMLAVKSILTQKDLVSLYIFDEVDSGLGGQTADKIGTKIQKVARGHQAIVITHLAAIAARADHHLFVSKVEHEGRTVSQVTMLKGKARAEEIARMIDGGHVSKHTRTVAKEMLERSRAA